ncbi:hypothetical protein AMK77_06245 [Escherichia coli]|nr:hypothetical protein AKK22_23745 [Escherichia coli]KHJ29515.1 hypothetical protein PU04_02765 [Escherichia coli]KLH00261.1 hypothetical protein WQ88_22375 [Escherichia coli]KYV34569.1 hypothetical protein AMK77_06245 [Escherichia coli]
MHRALRLMTNTALPDALRLPGLPDNCNILNFSRLCRPNKALFRIRHKQCVLCHQFERPLRR